MCVPVFRGALNGKALAALVPQFIEAQRERGHSRQNGVTLDRATFANDLLEWLKDVAEMEFGCHAEILFHQSSCRIQTPDGAKQLRPHQDGIVHPVGATFWCPLTPITEHTPTIAYYPDADMAIFTHELDENGYLIIPDWEERLQPIVGLVPGDVVVLMPNIVHSTFVPSRAKETRVSLDVRLRAAHDR